MNRHQVPDSTLSGYQIRPAVTADLDRLVPLMLELQDHLEASNPELWRMTPQARSQLRSQIATRLTAEGTCALVADHAEHGVVGMVFGRVATNNRYTPPRVGIIDQAFVREDHRRAGVGTCLVAGLCRFLAPAGVSEITLRYAAGNDEAAGFWSSLGFSDRIVTSGASLECVQSRLPQEPAP